MMLSITSIDFDDKPIGIANIPQNSTALERLLYQVVYLFD